MIEPLQMLCKDTTIPSKNSNEMFLGTPFYYLKIMANIQGVLSAAGMTLQDVVTVTAFITDINAFPQFNEVYREFFPEDPPARATVQVAALNVGAEVELQMIAVRP